MPLTRYQIRNEYGLADPELYRAADRDDSEALLEGVAMAGLVGVLRQLGDLAEFAAEIFHDLHEEVMATATRGHSLVVRVQQLEADFPSVEKALLSQTSHSSFFSNAGVDWHPNLRSEQSMVTRGDLPRFVRDSYEECRGPPRLFLLDKFDVAGAGACLKRYTDPSFFKAESASSITTVEMQREKKTRRVKPKKGSRWRNGGTPEVALTSHAKLQDLFLEERIENGYSDPARLVKLKKRHLNAVDSKTGRSYMKKFVETPSPERKLVCETSVTPLLLTLTSGNSIEQDLRILDISTVSPAETSPERKSASSSPSIREATLNPSEDGFNGDVFDGEIIKGSEPIFDVETNKSYSSLHQVAIENQISDHGEHNTKASIEGSTRTTPSNSDDMTSEVDNYMDALATMDSEMEMDSEYKPKNNLRILNVEKYGTDSDANEEEHLELQTRFSDSQSLGNSSTSDDRNNSSEKDRDSFSHSDTLSNLAPSECNGAPEEFSFNETCGAEVFEMSPSQRLEIVESLEATLKEGVVSHDTCIEEDIIPDSRDTSSIVFVGGTSPTLQQSPHGASLPLVSLPEPVLDETPSDEINGGYRSLDINENGTNVDDSLALVPDDFSQTKDESASHPVDDSDVEDFGISSDVLPHMSNVEELASEDQTRNNAANVLFQTHCDDEDSIESSLRRKIDSPRLSILPTEEQLFSAALPEVQTSSVNSETIPFVADAAWSHNSEELYLEGDASQASGVIMQQDATQTYALVEQQDATWTHGLIDHQNATQTNGIDQQFSDSNEDLPQLESISDVDVPRYKEKFIVEESSKTLDDDLQLFTGDVDMVGGDTVSVELPSNYPTHPGHGDHAISGDLVPETLHAEPVADHSAAVAQPHDDVNDVSQSPPNVISSPPRNFMNLYESLPGFGNFLEKESELDEVVTPETDANLEVQKEASKKEEVSPDSESESSKSTAYDHSSSKLSDDGHNFSLDQWTENGLAACVITAESNSSKTTAYDHLSSKVSNEDFSLDERTENSLAVCDVTAESNTSTSTTYGHSSSNVSDDGHDFYLDEQTENSSAVHGVTTASEDLEMSNLESESQSMDQSHREEAVSTPTCYIPKPGTSLEKSLEWQANQVDMEYLPKDAARDKPEADLEPSLEIQSDQLDVECSKEDQASIYLSTTQSAQIGSPAYMDKERSKQLPSAEDINQEICLDASSESCPENLPPQLLTSEFLPESAGQELHDMKQTTEPLDSTLARLALPHEATAGNQEDIPPLPPLPPMQWRMGKQNPSLASLRELVGVSQDSFLPIQPWEADEKAQFDMPAPQRFDMPAPQTFDMLAPQNFDMPAPQKFDIPEELCQPQNPRLPLPSLEDEKVQHASEPLMDNMVQPAQYSLHSPTMVKDANHQFNFPDLGGTHFPNPFLSSSEVSDDKSGLSGHNHFASEGEKVQSNSNPFTVPGTECTTSTHDPESSQGSTIPPMQKLTQETVSEPNVLQQSLKDSERAEEKPLATSVTAPAKVDERPQHSLPTSEGETAWSSNNSAMISDYDVGRTNEIPVSKLPRPRNPLIDAVAAHGQSKLRKVTERVLPQAEPKVDERDSLLQQIRTKSFNLKPATVTRTTVTRPSIPGPTTNLRVAAILEKANAIRQAFAGSDEDEDDDSWSDS